MNEQVVAWDVPVQASWSRASELAGLTLAGSKLILELVEEHTNNKWRLTFDDLQAFRFTSEECAGRVLSKLNAPGGFFEVRNSTWLQELKGTGGAFLTDARHFIVCCYDEVI